MATKNNWVRQPQERKGDYFFNGTLYITANLSREISQEEILWIVTDLKAFVQNEQGIDYLVIYIRQDGRTNRSRYTLKGCINYYYCVSVLLQI